MRSIPASRSSARSCKDPPSAGVVGVRRAADAGAGGLPGVVGLRGVAMLFLEPEWRLAGRHLLARVARVALDLHVRVAHVGEAAERVAVLRRARRADDER